MKGDRVKIITGTLYQDDPDLNVFVYGVELNPNGTPVIATDGTVQLQSLGGVKNGSTGVIMGSAFKAHRTQLKDYNAVPGLGTNDFVEVVPVMLDYYQQLGWFPTTNVRVMAGGVIK